MASLNKLDPKDPSTDERIIGRRFDIGDMFAAYEKGCKDSIYSRLKMAHAQRIRKSFRIFIEDFYL